MNSRFRKHYFVVPCLAFLWAVGNSIYVYLALGGARTYRVESAAFIFAVVLLPLVFWRPSAPHVSGDAVLTDSASRALMLLALALWLLTVGPLVALPFLGDDYVFLDRYRQLPDALRAGPFFRPLFAVLFFVLARIGDESTVPFHVAGFSLHVASAWFVYVLSHRLFGRTDAAAFSSAIFLLNPLQMEAVVWVSGLQELLWTSFVLAALVVYTGRQELSFWRMMLTLLFMACALLAKETAVASVVLVPAADFALFRMRRGPLRFFAYAAIVLVTLGYLFVRSRATPLEPEYLLTPGRYFVQKFLATPYKFFVQPWNPAVVHVPAIVACGAVVAAFTVVFLAVVRGAGPMTLAGPAVILMSTLPVYSYFFVREDLLSARYIYFAAFGWALLITQLLTTLLVRRRVIAAAFTAWVAVMFVVVQVNIRPWRTVGEIVNEVEANLRQGRSPARSAGEWEAKYGKGFEVENGIPTLYRGVYVFANGYPELRSMLSAPQKPRVP